MAHNRFYWEGRSRKQAPRSSTFRPPTIGSKFRAKKISGVTTALARKGDYGSSRAEWQRLRDQVLERDGYKCVKCGRGYPDLKEGERLECHHIRRLSRGGTDTPLNLTTLCSKCHAKQPGHNHLRHA